jgi:hypothetical protein
MLDALPSDVEVVMLTGRPAASWPEVRAWATAGAGTGWAEGDHWLGSTSAPVFRFRSMSGREVEVRSGEAWFGSARPEAAAEAWELVRQVVERRFEGGGLLASPGATGVELMARSIPPSHDGYPTVSDEVQGVIRAATTQGRNELVEVEALPALVEFDCRWAYAALCRELPSGPAVWNRGEPADWSPFTQGWYRCTVTVPAGWGQLGIVPELTADGWVWPRSGTITGWVSAVEVAQARRWGWSVTIHEGWTFPEPERPHPLDRWSRQLIAAREDVAQAEASAEVRAAASSAVRAILLHAIGSWWGSTRDVTRSAPIDQAEPAAGAHDLTVDGDLLTWTETVTAGRPAMVHPEWSATIWARCRARMLDGPGAGRTRTGALHVPAPSVVAIRTDALYLTSDPGWSDDGAVGRLYRRRTIAGPHQPPASHADLLTIRDQEI